MGNRSLFVGFVGLDVHQETIDVSIADGERDGEVRHSQWRTSMASIKGGGFGCDVRG